MQNANEADKLSVKNGFIVCPNCARLMHGVRIGDDTTGRGLVVKCKTCRTEFGVNIDSGQRVYRQRP